MMKKNLRNYLEISIANTLSRLGYESSNAFVTPSNRPELSDYQSNVAMSLAKIAHKSPIIIANEVKSILKEDKNFQNITVDGPGFINVSFSDDFLINLETSNQISNKKVIIDYGGPNIAKEMHVGHLRSAIIGESIKRIMKFCGDEVIGDVHFGDWGTPIGMLITQLKEEQSNLVNLKNFDMSISEISSLYKRANANFKGCDNFKNQARQATFELQNGNEFYRNIWKIFRDKSVEAVKKNYDKLGVSFDLWLGESDTNDLLPKIVDDLLEKQIAMMSNGAVIVPMPPKKNGDEKAPLILKKSDGAYTYAITDIATIVQRKRDFNPDAILYVVDARQSEHFEQVFATVRMANYVDDSVSLEHIAFGTVNGKDGKPFKTREGNVMNLSDLIELAEKKAGERIVSNSDKNEDQIHKIAIGALKFQDLKNIRTSNYIFDTENFTKSEGKTGAYIQYAIVRINSILDKSEEKDFETASVQITNKIEREILLQLKRFSEALSLAYTNREPSAICEYMYLLAQKFSNLYADVSINSEQDVEIRKSRLKLCKMIKDMLEQCLDLLGIKAPNRMLSRTNI